METVNSTQSNVSNLGSIGALIDGHFAHMRALVASGKLGVPTHSPQAVTAWRQCSLRPPCYPGK